MAKNITLKPGYLYQTQNGLKVNIFEKGDPFYVGVLQEKDDKMSDPQEYTADGTHIADPGLHIVKELGEANEDKPFELN